MSKPKYSANLPSEQGSLTATERMEIHSSEMQEVIGRMPHWIISRGITLICAVIIVLFAGTWFFTYPDVVSATITLTSQNPPAVIIARGSGKLQYLLVKEGQRVTAGDYLGVLENTGELPHILELQKMLPRLQEFLGNFEPLKKIDLERHFILGEIQNSHEIFLKNYADYFQFLKFSPKDGQQKSKLQQKLKLSFNNLREAMGQWEYKYVLRSSLAGTIAFTRFWSNNQNVTAGDRVFTLVPEETGEWIGQLILPAQSSARVKVGQRVRVKLDNFPIMEFGFVWGKIRSKSLLPVDNNYMLELCFPWGLQTTQGKTLALNHGMKGKAEIITENKRLLERLLSPFKSLLKQNFRGV
jgi:hypothetical protein